IRDGHVTGVQTCALPISLAALQDTLAQQMVNHLYNEFDRGRLTTLSGPHLGAICFWLRETFPKATLGSGLPGPRDITEVFRGQLFNYLQKAGTPEALQALQHMARLQPADIGVKWMIAEAQKASL